MLTDEHETDDRPLSGYPGVWRMLWRRRTSRACLWIVILFALAAGYGEGAARWYDWHDRTPPWQKTNMDLRYQPPGFQRLFDRAAWLDSSLPSGWTARLRRAVRILGTHPLGTDNLGRDVLQRTLQGARIAFQVGVLTSLIALPIGVLLGALGGYFGGRTDHLVVWIYTTVASMPSILIILAICMVVGRGLAGVYLGIGLTTWVTVCRLVRAEVMKHREQTYVLAVRALGAGHMRTLFRHILPNVVHVVIVVFSLRFPAAIGTEVFISFLGIGVQGEPSWGVMIQGARLRLWQGMWWELTVVTLCIFAVTLAFNLLGDDLRDALDPRLNAASGNRVS